MTSLESSEASGPGRPRGFDREEALAALVMLFWEKGYEATTQQDMVERTGLSSSSLFNSFGKKPEIFREVMEHYGQRQTRALEPLVKGQRGLEDLSAFFDRVEDHVAGRLGCPTGCLAVKTMTGPSDDAQPVADLLERYRTNLASALRLTLERASRLGEIRADRVEDRVQILSASLIGIMTTAANTPSAPLAVSMVQAIRRSIASM